MVLNKISIIQISRLCSHNSILLRAFDMGDDVFMMLFANGNE